MYKFHIIRIKTIVNAIWFYVLYDIVWCGVFPAAVIREGDRPPLGVRYFYGYAALFSLFSL